MYKTMRLRALLTYIAHCFRLNENPFRPSLLQTSMFSVCISDECLHIPVELKQLDFFVSYNSIFPLFDRVSFNEKYDLQYSGNPPDGSAWYASLNIVLCIGCLLLQVRSQKDPNIIPEEQIWNKYFRNASSCFLDLLFDDGSLLAIQALVGMVRDHHHYFRLQINICL
jgi:hypothetical protein